MTERDIFTAALEIADPAERARYVEAACGGDIQLRQRVEELLVMQSHVGDFMEQPLAAIPAGLFDAPSPWDAGAALEAISHVSDSLLQSGSMIGPYKLLDQIGKGGMGQVWRAEQQQPVRRTVALKVINPGMDSQAVLARFEAERHALERMEHNHIAKILDAGSTPDHRPYFAMELVKGTTITSYCDERHLDVKQRLELFGDVCQAVQHAHQKGIIHRDIKPSNVLVTSDDQHPVVKVIDFGIAKAISDRLTDKTLFTQLGQVVGTLEYMSPEQARLNHLDIDTRSDIYSLGVLLYELLTGTTPFERQRLREAAFDEMLRVIREEEPPCPSSKLSTSDTLPSVAANRAVEPARLSRLVRGDLDWVVMKALEKDRNRRYASASALASDIVRYLQDEPVSAGPPSPAYRLRKFLRRNQKSVIALSITLLALAAGLVAASWGWLTAQQAASAERLARATAESRLRQIEHGNNILTSIFDDLNPESTDDKPLRVALADRLQNAASQLATGEIGDPVTIAKLQTSLATSLSNLGFARQALPVFRDAQRTLQTHLGPDAEETLAAGREMAAAYAAAGQYELALSLNKEIVAIQRRVLGPTHQHTLSTLNNIATLYAEMGKLKEAAKQQQQLLVLFRKEYGADHRATFAAADNLAQAWRDLGEVDRAVQLLEETLVDAKQSLPPGHMGIANIMNTLAVLYRAQGKYDQAMPLIEEALAAFHTNLGADHPKTLTCAQNVAVFFSERGQTARALPILEEVLRLRQTKLGRDHAETLASINELGSAYVRLGQFDQALPLFQESLDRRRSILGAEHPVTLTSQHNLAFAYLNLGEFERGMPLLEETLAARQKILGVGHLHTLATMSVLARAYRDTGNQELALSLYRDALEQSKESLGADNLQTLGLMYGLAKTLGVSQQFDEGIALAEKAMQRAAAQFGDLPANIEELPIGLASLYRGAARWDDAENLLRRSLERDQQSFGRSAPRTLKLKAALSELLFERNQLDQAETLARECLALRKEKEPGRWSTFYTQCLLGAILVRQDDVEQAEPMLKEGCAALQQQAHRVAPMEREATLARVKGWLDELPAESASHN